MNFFFVILLFTIFVVWKCYWRIQMMYNSSILSLYTPDTFSVAPSSQKEHDNITQFGFAMAKTKSVVICMLLRDAAHKIPAITKRSEKLGEMFGKYLILIVENDSSDQTRQKLLEWKEKNSKVIILGCGVNVENCSISEAGKKTEGHSVDRNRITKMTLLRNIYLEYIRKNLDFDYTIVWDADIVGSVYLDGVANTIGQMNYPLSVAFDADAVCAYGIYRWGWFTLYYDTYAHIDENDHFHIDLKTLHDVKKGLGTKYRRGESPVKVVSCFGGFTVYKTKSVVDKNYEMSSEDNLECEHVCLHKRLKNVFVNPSMIHFVLLND